MNQSNLNKLKGTINKIQKIKYNNYKLMKVMYNKKV